MKKLFIISSLLFCGALISLAIILLYVPADKLFVMFANRLVGEKNNNTLEHSFNSLYSSNKNSSVSDRADSSTTDITNRSSSDFTILEDQFLNPSSNSIPSISDTFSGNDLHDLTFVFDLMDQMTERILSMEELLSYIKNKGYIPIVQRRGHVKSGFRQEIDIEETKDQSRLVKVFYGSYLDLEKDGYLFDKLYYGLSPKEYVFEHTVREINERISGKFNRRVIREDYAKWNFVDGSHIFVIKDHYSYKQKENVVLVGKEWEVH